jgi:hypothetical protein
MKLLRSFLLFLSAAFIIVSCQKELSFEEGTARGTLKEDATGECLPATVVGSYKRDTLLNTSNYVDIQVDITQTGTYVIKTDTLNGYSFSATGVAAVAGLNTIRLQASGRPVAAALDVFRVKFDTTSCEINIVVTGSVYVCRNCGPMYRCRAIRHIYIRYCNESCYKFYNYSCNGANCRYIQCNKHNRK